MTTPIAPVPDLQVLDVGANAVLHPLRRRILEHLHEADSASGLSRRMGLPRQKVNYHLRELEKSELVELVEERRRGNCVERVVRASARSYVISPDTLGALAADPARVRDRFSSAYLMALAARAIRDLGDLRRRAEDAGKKLPTLSMEAEVRFASAADRQAFAEELTRTVGRLVARYHDDRAEGGRSFKLVFGGYPAAPRPGGPDATDGKETNHDEG